MFSGLAFIPFVVLKIYNSREEKKIQRRMGEQNGKRVCGQICIPIHMIQRGRTLCQPSRYAEEKKKANKDCPDGRFNTFLDS